MEEMNINNENEKKPEESEKVSKNKFKIRGASVVEKDGKINVIDVGQTKWKTIERKPNQVNKNIENTKIIKETAEKDIDGNESII